MSTVQYADIDFLLDRIGRLSAARDSVDASFAIQAEDFVDREAAKLAVLLQELAYLRERASGGLPDFSGTHRFLAEGTSESSAEEALAHALSSAAHFFSEHHDVVLTLEKLSTLPGGAHRAVVEVHVTLAKQSRDPHIKNPLLDVKHHAEKQLRTGRASERTRAAHMIFDHFMHMKSGAPGNLPASFMVNITDAGLLNKMIEKQFFKSAHAVQRLSSSGMSLEDEPFTMLVRAQDPGDKPKPKPE